MWLGRENLRRQVVTILYVEDNDLLARSVRDALELAGWMVHHMTESYGASMLLKSEKHFDLLLLDQETRHLSGTELTRLTRQLPHRRETPIILCSIENCARAARRAGANKFLRKPANMIQIVDVVRRLLKRQVTGDG